VASRKSAVDIANAKKLCVNVEETVKETLKNRFNTNKTIKQTCF